MPFRDPRSVRSGESRQQRQRWKPCVAMARTGGVPAGVALLPFAQDGVGERGRGRAEVEEVVGGVLQGARPVQLQSAEALQLLRHVLHGRHLRREEGRRLALLGAERDSGDRASKLGVGQWI